MIPNTKVVEGVRLNAACGFMLSKHCVCQAGLTVTYLKKIAALGCKGGNAYVFHEKKNLGMRV